jgi:Fic family protein
LRSSQRQIRTTEENLDDWVRFFLYTLKTQKDALLRKIEREQMLAKLAPVSEQILILAKERGRVNISEAVALLGINRNTAKAHFRQLVHQGYLVQHGVRKSTWYSPGK